MKLLETGVIILYIYILFTKVETKVYLLLLLLACKRLSKSLPWYESMVEDEGRLA